jgi:hypothetical protein
MQLWRLHDTLWALLADIDARALGDVCSEHVPINTVTHVVIKKR